MPFAEVPAAEGEGFADDLFCGGAVAELPHGGGEKLERLGRVGVFEAQQLPAQRQRLTQRRLGLGVPSLRQEREPYIVEAVRHLGHGSGEDELLGLNYASIVPVVIRAIQQQQQILEEKDAHIRDLSEKYTALLRQLETVHQASARLESRLTALEEDLQSPTLVARNASW